MLYTTCTNSYVNISVVFANMKLLHFYIQKWSDKEDVLRKAKILKTSGIYVEEDFSRAAKFRRKELEKFAKQVKELSSDKKCIFK